MNMNFKTKGSQWKDEINEELQLIQQWQYKNYSINSLNYDCVLEDVKTYWNEEARFREGFLIDKEKEKITIPNFFIEIDGACLDKSKYKKLLNLLKEKAVPFSKLIPINSPVNESNYDRLISNYTNFIGDLILNKYQEYLKNNRQYSYYLYQFLVTSKEFQLLINNFDYPFQIPKIFVEDKELKKEHIYILNFINTLGIDIVFINVSGKNNKNNKLLKNLCFICLDKFSNKISSKEFKIYKQNKKNNIKNSNIKYFLIFSSIMSLFLLGIKFSDKLHTNLIIEETKVEDTIETVKTDEKINLNNLNTSKITDMSNMFQNCKFLTSLDLSAFDTSVDLKNNTIEKEKEKEKINTKDLSAFDTSVNLKNNTIQKVKEKIKTNKTTDFLYSLIKTMAITLFFMNGLYLIIGLVCRSDLLPIKSFIISSLIVVFSIIIPIIIK